MNQMMLWQEDGKPRTGRRSRAMAILEALKRGSLTTNELLEISTHRFSCDIEYLRKRGHKIRTSRITDENYRYEYLGSDPTVEVKNGMQERYYRSEHWKQVRGERMEFDCWKCVRCHKTERLQVHHLQYELFAESVVDHLITLCIECHQSIQGLSKVKFPTHVSPEVFELLEALV